jgi:ABC-2 type transport system ATP-binding protein
MVCVLPVPLTALPAALQNLPVTLTEDGTTLIWHYDAQTESDISAKLDILRAAGIRPKDIFSRQSSLEEIFIALVGAA